MKILNILIVTLVTLSISYPAKSLETPATEKMASLMDELSNISDDDFTCEYMKAIEPELNQTHNEIIEERNTFTTNRDKNVHAIYANDLMKTRNLIVAMYNATCV